MNRSSVIAMYVPALIEALCLYVGDHAGSAPKDKTAADRQRRYRERHRKTT